MRTLYACGMSRRPTRQYSNKQVLVSIRSTNHLLGVLLQLRVEGSEESPLPVGYSELDADRSTKP
ncbi:hypothetical protein RSAG8_06318, partial [Rhizoctonia solani AG-8 WAC10335]